ncbi:MAG: futalosine hydrolase [Saprospiraceae bacterium]
MKILIVAATPFEVAPLREYLEANYTSSIPFHYQKEEQEIILLITGVGMTNTAFQMGKALVTEQFQLAINAGVAGAYNRNLQLGQVVNVIEERYGDLGVEEKNGDFTDVFEMELINGKQAPFRENTLPNDRGAEFDFLPKVRGLTVNKVHGFAGSISRIKAKYQVDIETMESAAFFQACLTEEVPFLGIRAISNYVEPRNRAGWKLAEAIQNLNTVLIASLQSLG